MITVRTSLGNPVLRMPTYWNEKIETLPREELADLQLERLQVTLNRGYAKVDFYRQRFEELGFL
ncbi:MAG: hypothetical protein JRC67_03260, partial [Deltaproteobacteria bacterium]|nr:hypothetical protein [Deltaproteobacteria bacterium]